MSIGTLRYGGSEKNIFNRRNRLTDRQNWELRITKTKNVDFDDFDQINWNAEMQKIENRQINYFRNSGEMRKLQKIAKIPKIDENSKITKNREITNLGINRKIDDRRFTTR